MIGTCFRVRDMDGSLEKVREVYTLRGLVMSLYDDEYTYLIDGIGFSEHVDRDVIKKITSVAKIIHLDIEVDD